MCNICNISNNSNIDNILNDSRSDKELEYIIGLLNEYYKRTGVKIDIFSPELIYYVEQYLLSYIPEDFKQTKINKKITDNNIYNFSLAKTATFLNNMNNMKEVIPIEEQEAVFESSINTIWRAQLNVETKQVETIPKKVMSLDVPKNELLEYVTEGDNDVRKDHEKMGGTVLPKKDPFWKIAITHLSDWNCRCSIHATDNSYNYSKSAKEVKAVKPSEKVSDIDLISGRVEIFSMSLPIFKEVPPIIRRRFKNV